MKQAVMTLIGKDQPGIISRVTQQLYAKQCNLEDLSMTLLEGEFAMIVMFSFPQSRGRLLHQKLQALARQLQLGFDWKEVDHSRKKKLKHQKNTRPHILTAFGKDKSGIVYQITRLLARHRLNVTDLDCRLLSQKKKDVYALVLEVDIPKSVKIEKIQKNLAGLARQLSLDISFKPIDLLDV